LIFKIKKSSTLQLPMTLVASIDDNYLSSRLFSS
jgi:hypothetical protein